MKLLLDEMLPAVVAERLNADNFDVEAISRRPDLRGLADDAVLDYAQARERALVTYNRDDFLELDARWRRHGRVHHGIVILNPRRFPQGSGSVGPIVIALEKLLETGAPYDGFVHWLQ